MVPFSEPEPGVVLFSSLDPQVKRHPHVVWGPADDPTEPTESSNHGE